MGALKGDANLTALSELGAWGWGRLQRAPESSREVT